ncbi:hypothetical protein JL720_17093 [Aureococcus anophagefferens]|nr:hypothetical protein JL720_17093 [Aureococcus anophagefferens]
MEALALAHAWSLAPSVNWVRGSVLGAAFGDLWEAHPAFDRVVEVDATSDRGKSGGGSRAALTARRGQRRPEGVAVRDFADLTCAAPAGGPGSGPCKRVWRVPTSDGKLRAVTSRDFFEGRDGRNVSAVRVDDAAFCSARVLGWLDGFRPAAAAAAVLHRRPQSVIVHRDGCAGAPPASKRRSLDALQHSLFCRAHEEGTGDVPH